MRSQGLRGFESHPHRHAAPMRVIAGEFRSRRLKTLPGWHVRPTPDRLREALFNVLAPRIEGCTFLDAYAGTGAVGIEALSRGAARAIFVEKHAPALRILRENLRVLGLESRAQVVRGEASRALGRLRADIVFLDPPYREQDEYRRALQALARATIALVVVQHPTKLSLEETYGPLRRTRTLRQGDNVVSFFELG
ncbi:MAG: 16S rRNA (guanine(966)-N(2))-methyltransferase RsmD [Bryobacteraceae bacterium]|nr:16S rRNA (guanine(966)-N(2))-methyltransferase RsmD [Bryobacteraceae bacterium]